jgi:hypothetical protein
MSDTKDPLKGYRGLARSRLEQWGMRCTLPPRTMGNARVG